MRNNLMVIYNDFLDFIIYYYISSVFIFYSLLKALKKNKIKKK